MQKRTQLILSLIFSLFFLLYLLLEYYGIIRRIKLNIFTPEYYIPAYSKLEKGDPKNRTIVVFESYDIPFLNSLLDQSVKVDDFVLVKKEGKEERNEIPKVLNVYPYSKDYGDSSTLFCALKREPNKDTKIILINEPKICSSTFIQDILDKSEKDPTNIVYHENGILIKPSFFPSNIIKNNKGKKLKDILNEGKRKE